MMQQDDLAIEIEAPGGGKAFNLKVEWRTLAKALAKGVLDVGYGNYASALKAAIDGVDALRGKPAEPPTPAEQGWLWLHRGTMAALAATVRNNPNLTGALADSDDEMAAFVDGAQTADPVLITPDFFDHPADSPYFDRLAAGVRGWLRVLGAGTDEQERILRRLGQEFPIALDLEERQRRKEYEGLAQFFQPTMVGEAAQRQRAWRRYRASLVDAVRKPIFNFATDEPGAVSLKEIYVPLRAVYYRPSEDGPASGRVRATPDAADRPQVTPVFVWLADHIETWRGAARGDDALRILSGDPGSGKSAFGMMTAADWALQGMRVLRVPLHLIDFERDAFDAIRGFAARDDQLGIDPFEGLTPDEPLILLLDGLDELSKVNEQAGAAAKTFVESLVFNMHRENAASDRARMLALLAGRPIVTRQSTETFREAGQRVDILRLKVKGDDYPGLEADDALLIDQRDEWWRNYGRATGRVFDGLPDEYRGKDDDARKSRQIDDITAQPLLNYLLALVRDEKIRQGKATTVDSVHGLYTDLFDLLYRRRKGRLATRDQAEDRFEKSDYKRLLEEVAIAAWHGGDRSVTREAIETRFKSCDPQTQELLNHHYGSLDSGVFAVLSSFFVAPESGGGPDLYTFTHKSFREFLTASRLVREVAALHDLLGNPRNRYGPETALADWYALTAHAAMDHHLLAFVREELAASADDETAVQWRDTLKTLFEESLRRGMPGFDKAPDFRTAARRDRDAEAALFVMLSACHRDGVLAVDWQSEMGAYDFLRRNTSLINRLVLSCLRGIDLHEQGLIAIDVTDANLEGADLYGAYLVRAILVGANLIGANLSHANLIQANLMFAKLGGANLTGANLTGAHLTAADLTGAKARRKDFDGAIGANLEGVRFIETPPESE